MTGTTGLTKMIRLAINGFGRIGRRVFRLGYDDNSVNIVAINDLADPKTLAHLLKYDSVHGTWDKTVEAKGNNLFVNGNKFKIVNEKEALSLPWKKMEVDVVVESTGRFTKYESDDKGRGAVDQITAGAKYAIVSAPGRGMKTIVMGVNENEFDPKEHYVVSNASCTTNCLAPIAKVLHEKYSIISGIMLTDHAYTGDQRLVDSPHDDLCRARAAAESIIPTKTGAAEAIGEVIPELKGRINGVARRVPVSTVSLVDFIYQFEKKASADEVNAVLKSASENGLKKILQYCEEPLVSVDFKGNKASAIVNSRDTMRVGDLMLVSAWYDNETGYSQRLVDLAKYMLEQKAEQNDEFGSDFF